MQKFILKLANFSLIVAVLMLTACGEDDPGTGGTGGGGTVLGPEISFVADPNAQNIDFDVEETETQFTVIVRTIKGDGDLETVTITEGGSNLATSRFSVAGGGLSAADTPNNPFLIAGTAIDGADYTITIDFPTLTVGDFLTYVFTVADKNGETATIDIIAEVVAPAGTPLDNPDGISGVLLNQAGPTGTGGLDLDTGTGTGSADATAEIRDMGIDCTINPADAENWRAEFGTINGADMVRVDVTQVENFSFESVSTKEAIADAYANAGITLADGASQDVNCNDTAVTDVTGAVAVNDLFIVSSGDVFYLLRVDAINPVGGSNGDNFEFSVKF